MKTIRALGKNEEGSALLVGVCCITMLLGFLGLAMDVGNLVYTKTRMQDAVDAAAYGGGLNLPSTSSATTQATSILHSNDFPVGRPQRETLPRTPPAIPAASRKLTSV